MTVTHGTLSLGSTIGLTATGVGTGTVTLTGQLSDLNAALSTLQYTPTAGYHGADPLIVSDTDTADNLTGTWIVAITVNAAPTIAVPASVTVDGTGLFAFGGSNTISITDNSGTAEQLKLAVAHGTLTLGSSTGLTVTGGGTAVVTLTGSRAALNTALLTLKYQQTVGYQGVDTLNLSNTDTTDNLNATAVVAIAANVSPAITSPASVTVNGSGPFAFTGSNVISVTDAGGTTDQLKLTVVHGTLTLGSTTGLTVTGGGTAVVTLTGTPSALNAALLTLKYQPTASYQGTDTLSLSDKDTINSLTDTAVIAITVNVASAITAPASATVNGSGPFSFTGSNAISVTDTS